MTKSKLADQWMEELVEDLARMPFVQIEGRLKEIVAAPQSRWTTLQEAKAFLRQTMEADGKYISIPSATRAYLGIEGN